MKTLTRWWCWLFGCRIIGKMVRGDGDYRIVDECVRCGVQGRWTGTRAQVGE